MKHGHRYLVLGIAAMVASAGALLLVPVSLSAHHGTGISYDQDKSFTITGTVVSFRYINPHPFMEFTAVNERGEKQDWSGDMATNPSFLIRNGWTKRRSEEALKPGTIVQLTVAPSRAGGRNVLVRFIRNEQGQLIVNSGRDEDAPGAPRGGGAGRGGQQ